MGDRAQPLSDVPRWVRSCPRWLVASAFAAALAASFPFRAGELRFDGGLLAGWLALVPFVWLLRGLSPRAALGWATAAGTAACCAILFWIYVVVHDFGGAPAPFALLAVLLLATGVGLHIGLAGALYAWLRPAAGAFAPLLLAAVWVIAEHLRSFDLFSGFPWAYLGYAAHRDGPILALASVSGVWGLSFLLALFAALLAHGRIAAAILLLCAAHLAGFVLQVSQLPDAASFVRPATLRAALVQGNIAQTLKWDPALAGRHFEAHLELSRLAAAEGARLIVWPESAAPVFLDAQPEFAAKLVALSRETGATLVVGAMGLGRVPERSDPAIFNSAFVVTPERGIVDRYDKSLLVPFGEYVPLRALLGFVSAIATGLAGTTDITPGSGPRPLRGLTVPGGDHAAAALICYEVIYPGLVREAVRGGARLLLNITNDAWYGRTSAPHQFLAIAALRAAEHGLPMLRAANTGISAVVDAGGFVLEETAIFERFKLVVDVPPASQGPTLYTRFGDWPVAGSWLLLIGIGGVRFVRRDEFTGAGDRG